MASALLGFHDTLCFTQRLFDFFSKIARVKKQTKQFAHQTALPFVEFQNFTAVSNNVCNNCLNIATQSGDSTGRNKI